MLSWVSLLFLRRRSGFMACLVTIMLIACASLLLGILIMTVGPMRRSAVGYQALVNVAQLPEYKERLKRIGRVCRKYNLDFNPSVWKPRRNFNENYTCSTEKCTLVVDETSRLLACLLPKVACTTVKKYFLRVLNNATLQEEEPDKLDPFHMFADKYLHRVSPSYYQRDELDKFYKFMIVRHPFERIVSAFVDKALKPRSTNKGFYDRYWIPIMKEAGREEITNTTQPTFREFVHYLLRLPVNQYTEHWAPFWRRCDPCKVKYDFVGKLENAELDVPYALSKKRISSFSLVWNYSGLNSSVKARELFSELNAGEVFALYTKYFLDFELFGYTIDDFIQDKDVRYMDTFKIKRRKFLKAKSRRPQQ